jgi:hypothetical protein
MPGRARKRAFGAAATAITMIALMTSCASSGNPSSTQTAPTRPAVTQAATASATTPKEFVSTRYGLAVTLPQDWSETDALFAWDGRELQSPGSPFFANVKSPTGNRTLMAASAPVPKGMKLADWQAAMVRDHLSSCSEPSSVNATTLGGEPALTWTESCDGGTVNSNKVAALHGGRGYMIYMPSAAANDAEDRRIFEGMRQSFRFTS